MLTLEPGTRMISLASHEDEMQLSLLSARPGEHDSGLTRYAAAMYFFQRGMISAATLEVYRCCSPFDGEDPLPVLYRLGLAGEILPVRSSPDSAS